MVNRPKKKTVVWGDVFEIDLPPSWSWTDQEDVISVFREPEGVGAINISLARRSRPEYPSEAEARELAESYADQRGWRLTGGAIRITEISGCPASQFEFTEMNDETIFWKVWNIVASNRVAFLTYNCDPGDVMQEAFEREEIARSFRWL